MFQRLQTGPLVIRQASWKLTAISINSARSLSTNFPSLRARQNIPPRSTKMSWMDSWSRPSKSQATPAPYYLLPGGESTPYCQSCGRVIGSRRTAGADHTTPIKYCSARCRSHKPGKLDREIESAFVRFLTGDIDINAETSGVGFPKDSKEPLPDGQTKKPSKGHTKKLKGDQRILVSCSLVENFIFGCQDEITEDKGPSPDKNEADDTLDFAGHVTSTSQEPESSNMRSMTRDDESYIDGEILAQMSIRSGTRTRPPQSISEVNGSVGGERGRAERIEETDEMLGKRRQGQKRAKEREMVRCAARRGVVFGFSVDPEADTSVTKQTKDQNQDGSTATGEKRKCEAVMNGKVVEPSFAKGDWYVRWRA